MHCTVPTIHYSHNMRILKLPRTTPVGSLIYRLKASAAQETPLSFMVANGTDVNLITIKSVDFYQANVYLNKQLQVSLLRNLVGEGVRFSFFVFCFFLKNYFLFIFIVLLKVRSRRVFSNFEPKRYSDWVIAPQLLITY